jgi:hypothetical protein
MTNSPLEFSKYSLTMPHSSLKRAFAHIDDQIEGDELIHRNGPSSEDVSSDCSICYANDSEMMKLNPNEDSFYRKFHARSCRNKFTNFAEITNSYQTWDEICYFGFMAWVDFPLLRLGPITFVNGRALQCCADLECSSSHHVETSTFAKSMKTTSRIVSTLRV